MLKEMEKSNVKSASGKMNRTFDKIHDAGNPVSPGHNTLKNTLSAEKRELRLYDDVLLLDLNQKAVLISNPDDKGNCQVQLGAMKMRTNTAKLRLLDKVSEPEKPSYKSVTFKKPSAPVGLELDIRGKTVDEGLSELDKYLDSAVVAGLESVTVIHGKGTGVLREAVEQYLRRHNGVKNYRAGIYGEGDTGVTVVTLAG
ncbi:hypothetical protein FACS189499_08830 [Clostridia bacterium]|nr:hypothetical protein FACS189499_08830 [Clostridia bacterium]